MPDSCVVVVELLVNLAEVEVNLHCFQAVEFVELVLDFFEVNCCLAPFVLLVVVHCIVVVQDYGRFATIWDEIFLLYLASEVKAYLGFV